MTISISQQYYYELLQQTQTNTQADPTDKLDIVWRYPQLIGQGIVREVKLRNGLSLNIFDCRLQDTLKIKLPERQTELRYHFHLSGQHQDYDTTVGDREFAIYGCGCSPAEVSDTPSQAALEVTICVEPKALLSFIGDNEQLPPELQHLIRPSDRLRYARVGQVTPRLEGLLWQILRCPHLGITKRIYLESKALELMSLLLEQEIEINRGKRSRLLLLNRERSSAFIMPEPFYYKTSKILLQFPN